MNSPYGSIVFVQTPAETNASITPAALQYIAEPWYDVRRVGILPNDTGARTANSTALKTLLDPTTTGPVGRFVFPNTTGTDIYYFDDVIPIRDGCHLDFMGCTIDFAKSYVAADNDSGFLYFQRDVSIQNGTINVNYDGSAGSNAGAAIRIGNRSDTGAHFPGDDEDFAFPQGNIVVRDLRILSNHPTGNGILLLGGLDNVVVENVYVDMGGTGNSCITYEFGFAHIEEGGETKADRVSSHAQNMHFKNIHVVNCTGVGLELTGAYNCTVENLIADATTSAFVFRPGEALFYNVWAKNIAGQKRNISLTNIVGQNLTGNFISLGGAEDESSGYLNGQPLTDSDRVDQMRFQLDGFSCEGAAGVGLSLSAPCVVRNGSLINTANEGIRIHDECVDFSICRVEIRDGATSGIRANFGGATFSPERQKVGSITNCFIAGNADNAINIDHTESVHIAYNRIGYSTAHDATAELTQDIAVLVGLDGGGVVCEGNLVHTSGSANAYQIIGSSRNNEIRNPKGDTSRSGPWAIDGIETFNATNIADKTHSVNMAGKYLHKKIWDSSNNRLLVALGATDVSGWRIADGSATVTPA